MYKGSMITTHGYFYDVEESRATWLSDTWALEAMREPHLWQRLSGHLPQVEAFTHYSKGRTPPAPCGRFGHAAAVVGDALLLHGGHDGGYSRTNRDDYRPQNNDFDELWRFDIPQATWTLLKPQADSAGATPGRRYLAAGAAVDGLFVQYGGQGAGKGDVWAYHPPASPPTARPGSSGSGSGDLGGSSSSSGGGGGGGGGSDRSSADGRWERLSAEVSRDNGGPGNRMGHSLLPWRAGSGTSGLLMYGGQSSSTNGSGIVNGDAWFFDLATRTWRNLLPVSAGPAGAGVGAGVGVGAGAEGATQGGGDGSGGDARAGAEAGQGSSPSASGGVAPPATVSVPPGRVYHAAMVTTVSLPAATTCSSHSGGGGGGSRACGRQRVRVGVIAGGTLALPGIRCAQDAWAFTLDCTATRIAWSRLPDLPAALYDTHGAAWAGAAFLFGGHLCDRNYPPHPPYPYYYVNEVLRLDLAEQPGLAEWLGAVLQGGSDAGAPGAGWCAVEEEGQPEELDRAAAAAAAAAARLQSRGRTATGAGGRGGSGSASGADDEL